MRVLAPNTVVCQSIAWDPRIDSPRRWPNPCRCAANAAGMRGPRVRHDTTMIRVCTAADAGAIAQIYNHYVRETVVTFEETPVSPAEMARRIADVGARFPWLVSDDGGAVVGWAYAT